MIDNVRVCGRLIADEVAYAAIANSKLGMRVGFVAAAIFNVFCYLYGPALSKCKRIDRVTEAITLTVSYFVFEIMGLVIPKFYAGNYKLNEGYYKSMTCQNLISGKNVEADFTQIVQTDVVLIVQSVALVTMIFFAASAAKKFKGFLHLKPTSLRFTLAWVLPLTIFASGFIAFFQPEFNKIILAQADFCIKGRKT